MSNNLFTTEATGATRSATADEILDAARTILAHRVRRGAAISNPRHTHDYLRLHLAPHDHEIFAILFLDTRIRDALALVDIRVLDHLVVTGDTIVSFADRGLL